MRTFLRFTLLAGIACAALILCIAPARAQSVSPPMTDPNASAAGTSLWRPPAITNGTVVRIKGRQFVVNANINYGPIFWLGIPQSSTMYASVSISPVGGGFLPQGVSATNITLLAANRPVWRSALSVSFFLRPVWPPPYWWGQYQAAGVPLMAENRPLLARIRITTGRGTVDVDVPVTVPRPTPILVDPLATNP